MIEIMESYQIHILSILGLVIALLMVMWYNKPLDQDKKWWLRAVEELEKENENDLDKQHKI